MTTERPGNLVRANAIPSGIPKAKEMKVAVHEIFRESQVIAKTSGSKLNTSSNARTSPCQSSSTLTSELFFFLPRYRREQRLAEFFHTEIADGSLSLGRDHKIGERFSTRYVDARSIRRI